MEWVNCLKRGGVALALSFMCALPGNINAEKGSSQSVDSSRWQDFVSTGGKYRISFPSYPQHVSETLNLQNGKLSIKYDAYIAEQGVEALYMVLIAQYPKTHVRPNPEAGLKAFLNGILAHGENSELIQVEWQQFQGCSAVDFLINNHDIFLRGRAVMVENNLYLIAMESHKNAFKVENFNYFIETFQLVKD